MSWYQLGSEGDDFSGTLDDLDDKICLNEDDRGVICAQSTVLECEECGCGMCIVHNCTKVSVEAKESYYCGDCAKVVLDTARKSTTAALK